LAWEAQVFHYSVVSAPTTLILRNLAIRPGSGHDDQPFPKLARPNAG
jgi:hypothetical protein